MVVPILPNGCTVFAQWLDNFFKVCNGYSNFAYMNDIQLNTGGDLEIKDGDFAIGDATLRHQEHIIIANKGEFKESPEIGVGIIDALNSENPKQVLSDIKRNFEYDGMDVKTLRFTSEGKIDVDAEYKTGNYGKKRTFNQPRARPNKKRCLRAVYSGLLPAIHCRNGYHKHTGNHP